MPSRAARAALRTAGALALAVLGAALPVLLLVHFPPYTRALVLAVDAPGLSGLSPQAAVRTAEEVRRVAAGAPEGGLPGTVEGRRGFGEREREHLADVRDLVAVARGAALAAILGAAVWWAAARRSGREEVAAAARSAGWLLLGVTGLAALVGLADFGRLFERFHDVLFAPGTWMFPYDSLLVRLFPGPFWAVSAAAWGGLSAASGLALLISGRRQRTEQV
ncbi:MAG: DUF1461 domain-containing protein [Coriobacteriia bacterium]|nr:DUF1461 domain-containing protein [Coriobacteriia bacterium]